MIDETLARHLVTTQFPKWKDLPIQPASNGGWDNRIFRLGKHMLIRMPSAAVYAAQVDKEHKWLPKLAPLLPLSIPQPLAMGQPGEGYPWKWSIYSWLEGDTAASAPTIDLRAVAQSLAQFLLALQRLDPKDGPQPGLHNFYRGGVLATYDTEIRQAITTLKDKIDVNAATEVWERALSTTWRDAPVWVHGDVSSDNLLVQEGNLSSVIDFGLLAVGDPACDLAIAWTLFKGESREVFRAHLPLDEDTWTRGKAWTLWKALIAQAPHSWRIIDDILSDL